MTPFLDYHIKTEASAVQADLIRAGTSYRVTTAVLSVFYDLGREPSGDAFWYAL